MPEHSRPKPELPPIPAKRYFTIGEVSELCAVKPHVLRYWEQEFAQLKPVKRRGNRRYYQHHEVLLIRRIRDLLYEQGFTINGARHRLESEGGGRAIALPAASPAREPATEAPDGIAALPMSAADLRHELQQIRQTLDEVRRLLARDA
jgi:DNA-binding transcriptional MerR regulator